MQHVLASPSSSVFIALWIGSWVWSQISMVVDSPCHKLPMFLEHEGTGEKVSSNLYFYHLSLLRVQCQLPRLSYSVSIVLWTKNDFRHEESKRSIPPGHGASPISS